MLTSFLLWSCLATCAIIAGCAKQELGGVKTYADFIGSDFTGSLQAGEVYDVVMEQELGTEKIDQFENITDMLGAVDIGKVDFAVMASDSVYSHTTSGEYQNLTFTFLPSDMFTSENAQIFHTQELADQYNAFIDSLIESGELADMIHFWLSGALPEAKDIPVITGSEENGEIVFAASGGYAPMYYVGENGENVGFNKEMSERFAAYLGKKPVFVDMNYAAILPYVQTGKADMSACCFSMTNDREDSDVFFCKPYMSSYIALAYRSTQPTVAVQNVYGVLNANGTYDIYHMSDTSTSQDGTSSGTVTPQQENPDNLTVDDIMGKTFSARIGTIYDALVHDYFEPAKVELYEDAASSYAAVSQGKVEFAVYDKVMTVQALKQYPDLAYLDLPESYLNVPDGYSANFSKQALVDEFNAYLKEVVADGTIAEMTSRWLSADFDDQTTQMPAFHLEDNTGETIRIACDATNMPFAFVSANETMIGFDVELMTRFAEATNRKLEFQNMAFNAIMPTIASGKADMGIGSITITEERKEMVLFTDPVYYERAVVAYRVSNAEEIQNNTFFAYIKKSIWRNLIEEGRYQLILRGLLVTMNITVCSMLIGTILGGFVAFALTRKNRVIQRVTKLINGLINGLPTVTLLLVAYYIIFGSSQISNVIIAIATFSMIMAIRIGEVLAAAIETIDPIQIEAARACGFSATGAFMNVTLPQAIKHALSPYLTNFVSLMKETAIVGYVAIQDLMRASDIIRSRTYDAYFPLLFAALIYLIVTTVFILLFKAIIKKVNHTGRA
jgi:polar amino acid transport system substrate-binding protein